MTFGIAEDILPVDLETGESNMKAHLEWIETQKTIEQEETSKVEKTRSNATNNNNNNSQDGNAALTPRIEIPGPMDIVKGRGRQSHDSPGYSRFRMVLEERRDEYDNAKRNQKPKIANEIRIHLREMGCRFLKRVPPKGWLEECSEEEAVEKICHAFRNFRSVEKQQFLQQQVNRNQSDNAGTTGGTESKMGTSKRNVEEI